MASNPVVMEASELLTITGVTAAFQAGDLVWSDGTGSTTIKADADTPATKYCVGVAVNSIDGDVNQQLVVAKRGVIYDADAPYTAGAPQYLSATAGAHTGTRPATAAQLRQVVGCAISTSLMRFDIKDPHEVEVPIRILGGTSAYTLLDSGNFGGPTLDAQNETLSAHWVVPENAIGIVIAKLHLAAEATAGTPVATIATSGAQDGDQWDANTEETAATQALEGAAADELEVLVITTLCDATTHIEPGASVGLKVTKSDSGTDISLVFGGVAIYKCV